MPLCTSLHACRHIHSCTWFIKRLRQLQIINVVLIRNIHTQTRLMHAQKQVHKTHVRCKGFQEWEEGLTWGTFVITLVASVRRLDWAEESEIYIQTRIEVGGPEVLMLGGWGRGWSSGKMHAAAGSWVCGAAEIWGSDSRLLFLLYNQFAVWTSIHTNCTARVILQKLSSFPPPPIIFDLFFVPAHMMLSRIHLLLISPKSLIY